MCECAYYRLVGLVIDLINSNQSTKILDRILLSWFVLLRKYCESSKYKIFVINETE